MDYIVLVSYFEHIPSVPYSPLLSTLNFFFNLLNLAMEFFNGLQVFLPRFNNANFDIFKNMPNFFWRCIACLLTSFLFTMSAPLPPTAEKPFWINPCKMETSPTDDNTVITTTIEDVFDEVINNSNVCYLQSREVKEHLLQNMLNGIEEESLQDQKYDWLQSPTLEPGRFGTLNRDDAVKDLYYLLQKFAVVIDQMTTDQSDKKDYIELLLATKAHIIQVLCSLQLTMMSLEIKPHPDATHEIMDVELRTLSESGKLLRDFIVIREFHLTSRYTKELMKFFKDN